MPTAAAAPPIPHMLRRRGSGGPRRRGSRPTSASCFRVHHRASRSAWEGCPFPFRAKGSRALAPSVSPTRVRPSVMEATFARRPAVSRSRTPTRPTVFGSTPAARDRTRRCNRNLQLSFREGSLLDLFVVASHSREPEHREELLNCTTRGRKPPRSNYATATGERRCAGCTLRLLYLSSVIMSRSSHLDSKK
jgi:hypothetical protein